MIRPLSGESNVQRLIIIALIVVAFAGFMVVGPILAVEQVVGPERRALDGRQRIGRCAGGRPPRGAQNPSMLCT